MCDTNDIVQQGNNKPKCSGVCKTCPLHEKLRKDIVGVLEDGDNEDTNSLPGDTFIFLDSQTDVDE